ncbi:MAG TPA: helix-turn-helix domain-containing protein [Candidatus Paceibacterota bacterium]
MGSRREAERKRAIQLRLSGKSYNEIRKILQISSKGTISSWLSGLELTSEAKNKLQANIQRAHDRGLLKFNVERSSRIKLENRIARKEGAKIIRKLSGRELTLVGAALYWGEGTKNTNRPSNPSLSFANSDPKMVGIFMRFLREIIKVSEGRIRAGIHIYPSIVDQEARAFWSEVTKLPPDRFFLVRQISKASKGRRDPKLLPFGTVVIRVNDRRIFHKICGMVDGLALN